MIIDDYQINVYFELVKLYQQKIDIYSEMVRQEIAFNRFELNNEENANNDTDNQ